MIRATLQRIFGQAPEDPTPEPAVEAAPDPRGAPGTRVYHEYLVEQRAMDLRFSWMCRVYAQNGACTEQEGVADTADAAKNAALSFAAVTKKALRGEV